MQSNTLPAVWQDKPDPNLPQHGEDPGTEALERLMLPKGTVDRKAILKKTREERMGSCCNDLEVKQLPDKGRSAKAKAKPSPKAKAKGVKGKAVKAKGSNTKAVSTPDVKDTLGSSM